MSSTSGSTTGRGRRKTGAPPPGAGTKLEQLNEDQVYSLTEQHRKSYERLLAAKKAADANLKNHCKIIKADLGASGLEDIKCLIEAATPEGEARLKAEVERQMRVLRWMNVPIGTQGEIFPKDDRTPLVDRAFADGKRQGLAGETRNNPHHHTTAAHASFNKGYDEGQATLAAGFKKAEPQSSGVPKDQWASDLRAQNEAVERQIKEDAKTLGSQPSTFKIQ